MICPNCKGKKKIHGVCCPGFKPITMDCDICYGTGEVSPEKAARIETGAKLREMRVKCRETLRACAERAGISASDLSAMERGIQDPAKHPYYGKG